MDAAAYMWLGASIHLYASPTRHMTCADTLRLAVSPIYAPWSRVVTLVACTSAAIFLFNYLKSHRTYRPKPVDVLCVFTALVCMACRSGLFEMPFVPWILVAVLATMARPFAARLSMCMAAACALTPLYGTMSCRGAVGEGYVFTTNENPYLMGLVAVGIAVYYRVQLYRRGRTCGVGRFYVWCVWLVLAGTIVSSARFSATSIAWSLVGAPTILTAYKPTRDSAVDSTPAQCKRRTNYELFSGSCVLRV